MSGLVPLRAAIMQKTDETFGLNGMLALGLALDLDRIPGRIAPYRSSTSVRPPSGAWQVEVHARGIRFGNSGISRLVDFAGIAPDEPPGGER